MCMKWREKVSKYCCIKNMSKVYLINLLFNFDCLKSVSKFSLNCFHHVDPHYFLY